MSLLLLVLLLLSANQQLISGFQIEDCTRGAPTDAKLKSFLISACPDARGDRCDVIRGSNVTVTMSFEPTAVFTQAHFKVAAKLAFGFINLPIGGPRDACGHYGLTCPSLIGRPQEMQISFWIKRKYPSIKTTIRAQILDEQDRQIVCVKVPIRLKKK